MIEVIKGGMNAILGLTTEQELQIKNDLTLENPVYKQVKRYSRYRYTSVPKYLEFYYKFEGSLIVPRGYVIPFKHKVIEDNRANKKTPFPKFKLKLRETQKEAYEAWKSNTDRGTIVLQTGKGKSILGCYLAYATKQRTLIIVQKNDLVDGWMKDIELCFGLAKDKIGLIKAGKKKLRAQFTIATIQSLSKLSQDELAELYNKFGMIIVDEFHHSVAKSYEMLKHFQPKYMIGLTATDKRTDGLQDVLYWMFGDVAYRSKEDVNDEDIMPYKVIIRKSSIKYNPPERFYYGKGIVEGDDAMALKEAGKKLRRAPMDAQALRRVLRDKDFNNMVADDIKKEYEAGKSCIAFLHEKEHIRGLMGLLVAKRVPESQIQLYYGDSKIPDSILKERAESKKVLITLATFAKATEGTNVKSWERGFLVTSINNEKNTIQAVGRCRRRKEGKEDVIIYDYIHPKAKGLNNHIKTRLKAYKANKAKIVGLEKQHGRIKVGWVK